MAEKSIHIHVPGPVAKEDLMKKVKQELDKEHPAQHIESGHTITVTVNRKSAPPKG